MKLIAHRFHDKACQIVPASPERDWMNETIAKSAYKCLPLVIANTCGWDLLLDEDVSAVWNGGQRPEDLIIPKNIAQAESHFGSGVITFLTGYVFQTEPGWSLFVKGSSNRINYNIMPLEGIVETSWLPFHFTMNWRFATPGKINLKKGTPICTIVPIRLKELELFEPEIVDARENPDLVQKAEAWSKARIEHQENKIPTAQGFYTKGIDASGEKIAIDHIRKLKLKPFVTK